jgi:aminoglycoside phosphotransferase
MTSPKDLVDAVLAAAGVDGALAVEEIGHGASGDLVLRIDAATPLFVKIADAARRINVAEIRREAAALRWLTGRFPAPRPLWAGDAAGCSALITEGVAGEALHAVTPEQAEAAAIATLRSLARLHALPVADCPFDERLAVKLAESRRRVEFAEIEVDRLDPSNAGRSPAAIFADLIDQQPGTEDLVVTHGDACWPNFILRPDGEIAIIDLGRFGVADRHQDLALFIRSGRRNFPDLDIEALMARHYPVAADPRKLAYYRQLDELY